MALMLRMGAIPARVATGFTPGTRDATSGDWIVRDVNAHSWVEAWFPRWGWVTFDPTPPSAPARFGPAATSTLGGTARRGDVPVSGRRGVTLVAPRGGVLWPLPVGGGTLLALAGFAVVLRRRKAGEGDDTGGGARAGPARVCGGRAFGPDAREARAAVGGVRAGVGVRACPAGGAVRGRLPAAVG